MALSRTQNRISWILQIIVAVIFLQTLFFKFAGAEESIAIFTTLGMEPWGRYGTGVVELIASILLLLPGRAAYGAVLGAGMMMGAIGSHLTQLGIEVADDGGTLFALATVALLSSLGILYLRRSSLPIIGGN